MKMGSIKTIAEYESTLARIDKIFDAVPGTPQGDELDMLVTLVERYEEKEFSIEPPDLSTAIRFRMEQQIEIPVDVAPKTIWFRLF